MKPVTQNRKSAGRWAALFAIVALVLAACGGSGDTDTAAGAAGGASEGEMLTLASHDEIVAKAEEVGEVDVLLSLDDLDALAEGFSAVYPNLDVNIVEFSGTDVYQRFALEAAADAVSDDWDVAYAPPENYDEFSELMAPYDIYGMAEEGTLDIPLEMIDPVSRMTVATSSQIGGIGYNRELLAEDDLPETWEDLLDEQYTGQFVLDVRPSNLAPMVAVWGEEKTYEFAKNLAAQEPSWVRGNTDALTRIQAGENSLMVFANYHSGIRAMEEDPGGPLQMALIEPVPVRIGETLGVFGPDIADNPWGALLFIEWMTTPEAQEILDADPLKSSIYSGTGRIGELVAEYESSIADFEHFAELEGYMDNIVEEFGFPQAEGEG